MSKVLKGWILTIFFLFAKKSVDFREFALTSKNEMVIFFFALIENFTMCFEFRKNKLK